MITAMTRATMAIMRVLMWGVSQFSEGRAEGGTQMVGPYRVSPPSGGTS